MNNTEDDGSLAFLKIPRDENNRSFNCDETTQSKLVNTEFWVVDFIEEVPTRFSKSKGTKGQTLVKIKRTRDAPETEAKNRIFRTLSRPVPASALPRSWHSHTHGQLRAFRVHLYKK